MRRKHLWTMLLAISTTFILAFSLTACAAPAAPAAPPTEAAADETPATEAPAAVDAEDELYFVIISKYVHPWFDDGAKGFDVAAAEIGNIRTRYVSPDAATAEAQVRVMEDILAENPDGIAIAVNTPDALTPVINDAISRGIQVVSWDDTAWESDQLMFFGTDNYDAGVLEGEQAVELMGGEGNYIIICHETVSANTLERIGGIQSVLDQYPGMVMLTDETPVGASPAEAFPVIESLLTAYGDEVDIFLDTNLLGTIALHQTLKERGVEPGEYKIITWTLLPEIIEALEEGYAQMSLRQNPYAMGYLAAYGLKFAVDGMTPSTDFFSTGITLATLDNLAGVEEENISKVGGMLEEMKKLWK
jgi:rhamnose transport system substrate-binding protein